MTSGRLNTGGVVCVCVGGGGGGEGRGGVIAEKSL